jgi:hypothetical protein
LLDEFQPEPEKLRYGFYTLCLAELGAATHLVRSDVFGTREIFIAELKRLEVHPTKPSRVVSDLQEYNAAQKWWIENLLPEFEGRK